MPRDRRPLGTLFEVGVQVYPLLRSKLETARNLIAYHRAQLSRPAADRSIAELANTGLGNAEGVIFCEVARETWRDYLGRLDTRRHKDAAIGVARRLRSRASRISALEAGRDVSW